MIVYENFYHLHLWHQKDSLMFCHWQIITIVLKLSITYCLFIVQINRFIREMRTIMYIFLWKIWSPCNCDNYALGNGFLTKENAAKTKRIRKPGLMCDFWRQSILFHMQRQREVATSLSSETLQSPRTKTGNWISGIISIPFMLATEINSWISLFYSAPYVGRLSMKSFPAFI